MPPIILFAIAILVGFSVGFLAGFSNAASPKTKKVIETLKALLGD